MPPTLAFINPRLSTTNTGDVFIESSLKRMLDFDAEHSIDVDPRVPITPDTIARMNECDAAVIIGTNLWYRQLHAPGRWMFTVDHLKALRIPIVPLGVGTTRHEGEDNGFEPDSLDQLRMIHEGCASGSVRDERTVEALAEAGIDNVIMTGCPTLYRALEPTWSLNPPRDTRRVVTTVRKGHRVNVRELLRQLRAAGWDPIVAAQQPKDMLFAKTIPFVQRATETIREMSIEPYARLVAEAFGVIGWRLHGNMLHLAHGNPAVFFANCSRAASFCETFGLPCVVAEDKTRISPNDIAAAVERLTDRSVFDALETTFPRYRAEFVRCLEANGLTHNLKPISHAEVSAT